MSAKSPAAPRASVPFAAALRLAVLLAAAWPGAAPALRADEGMWTFDHLPAARLQAKYGFTPDAAWLDRLRLSVLRFPGGTGAFISKDGLVLTNHHVAHGWIEKVADAAHDYVRDGFLAGDRSRELKVPGLTLRTLMAMENVTAALERAAPPGAPEDRRPRPARRPWRAWPRPRKSAPGSPASR